MDIVDRTRQAYSSLDLINNILDVYKLTNSFTFWTINPHILNAEKSMVLNKRGPKLEPWGTPNDGEKNWIEAHYIRQIVVCWLDKNQSV